MEKKELAKEQRIYEMGKRDGRKEVIEKLIELLGLDDRYLPKLEDD